MICQGKNHKGLECRYKSLENDKYCKLHQSYKKMIELKDMNIKICTNWIRGCWNILNDKYERCLDCRLKERETEKILRNKKKNNAIEFNNAAMATTTNIVATNINDSTNTNTDIVTIINTDTTNTSTSTDTITNTITNTSTDTTVNTINKKLMCILCNKITDIYKNSKCNTCYTNLHNSEKTRNIRDIFLKKLYEYKSSAKKRSIEFKLGDEICFKLFNSPCNYCLEFNEINGIDRLDSNKCYDIENCVACCKQCNLMKNDTDQTKFIKLCEHIASYNKLYSGLLYTDILVNTKFGRHSQYLLSAEKRNIKFELSKNDFIKILSNPCYYCGVEDITYYKTKGAGGIDRVDSNGGYNTGNCVACCGMCNQMKMDYTKEEFLNKCIKIISNIKNINNKINMESELITMFYKLQNIKKQKKKKFNHSKEYYENKIWSGDILDIEKIKIKLIIADNDILYDMWKYYKYYVSSLKLIQNSQLVGRQIYIIVADEITDKYLGIISLSSDYLFLGDRDDFIGWTKEQKINEHKLNNIMNISTCVPLQPFGFNFTGGKLLTKLIFSQEIQNIFREKYNQPLLGITTTSLYGKSIQYDRLKEIKLVGFTKGNSVYKYPTYFIKKCKKYLKDCYNITLTNKLYIISQVLQKLELPKDEFMSANPKGIYFGFVYPDSKDFLCNKIEKIKDISLKSIDTIFKEWFIVCACKRYNHLIITNRIQLFTKNNSSDRTKKCLENLKNKLGEIEYKKQKSDYMKKYRTSKQTKEIPSIITETNSIIASSEPAIPLIENIKYAQKPDLPEHFSLYQEKSVWYLSFSKIINKIRYTKKKSMNSMCIQTELDYLIKLINEKYTDLKINNYQVIKPYDFIDKIKKSNKPELPINLSICNTNDIDYIQFSKKIDGRVKSYSVKIDSYDLQSILTTFVTKLNNKYNLNIPLPVLETTEWKTTNKISNKNIEI